MYRLGALVLLVLLLGSAAFAEETVSESVSMTDPTRPLGYRVAKKSTLNLSTILISNERKVAIINGYQLVKQDRVPGSQAKIMAIGERSVTLDDGQKRWVLSIKKYPAVVKVKR